MTAPFDQFPMHNLATFENRPSGSGQMPEIKFLRWG
jgi:hypothetical protein